MRIIEVLLGMAGGFAAVGAMVVAATVYDAWLDCRNVKRLGITNGRAAIARAYLRSQVARLVATLCLGGAVVLVLVDADRWGVGLFVLAQLVVAVDAVFEWRANRRLLRDLRP